MIPLTADELGEAGELQFADLAARAKLFANKSQRDRTGWDYVVEFPMPEAGPDISLDTRRPTLCMIQVKATTGREPVRLRLSSAERLAKQEAPSFIVVMRLARDGSPLHGYLIHLIGPNLAKVLRRLRLAHANDALDVNHVKISFDYRRHGVRFELTPSGLREALESAIGPDAVAEKRTELETLGYEDGHVTAKALVEVESPQAFEDMLLGLRSLRPRELRAFDTRFGVTLPYRGPLFDDVEEFRLDPPSLGPCILSIRGAPLSPSAVFEAELGVGPTTGAPDGIWLWVKHREFVLKFREKAVNFSSVADFETTPRRLEAWIPLIRGLRHLATGQGEILLSLPSSDASPLRIPLTSPLEGPYLDLLPELDTLLTGWNRLLSMAGVDHGAPFVFQDIFDARIVRLATHLFGPSPAASFMFDRSDLDADTQTVQAVYINTAELGGAAVSFAVRVTLGQGAAPDQFRSNAFEPLDARARVPDLQLYAEEMAEAHGCRVIIHPANLTEVEYEHAPALAQAIDDPAR